MKRIFSLIICTLVLGWGLAVAGTSQQHKKNQKVYYNAFSHNDYEHDRPLFDALDLGFNCVEADLWLIDGELYVSHDKPEISPDITFEKLYLRPLAERIAANKGKVHRKGKKPFFLMIDCKSDGEEMLPIMKKKLEPYRHLFCSVENGKYKEGAVLLFLSGDNPRQTILSSEDGYIFLDGRINDLGKNIDSRLMPVISDSYTSFLKWKGEGEIPEAELEKMRGYIRQAHKEGKLFRWYGAPDTPQFKRFFLEEGVDLVGADDLQSVHKVLQEGITGMVMARSKIIAHQGYHATKNSVGNSLSSLKNAQDAGFFGTEFDVHETKDGVLIVGHGPEHGPYIIQETDFKTLRAHKLKNGETLPTFEECLIQGKKNVATKLIIEIKRHPSPDLETRIVKKILAEVKKHQMEEHVEYISFHQHVCNELIKYGPKGIQVAYLEGNLTPAYCKGLGYTGIDYQVNVMREHPEWIKEAQDLGMTVNVWEADDIESAKWCIEHGLDYITTDIPADVERLLKEKNK